MRLEHRQGRWSVVAIVTVTKQPRNQKYWQSRRGCDADGGLNCQAHEHQVALFECKVLRIDPGNHNNSYSLYKGGLMRLNL